MSAGFDAVEVHLGHNYLLSSFMSPNLNKRKDELRRQHREPGHASPAASSKQSGRSPTVAWRCSRSSTWPTVSTAASGSTRASQFARLLEADGHLDALELTGGSSLLNGMYFFRGDVPMREFAATQSRLVGLGLRVFGGRIFPEYPFEEAFFLPFARQFRDALDMPLVLLGGINELATIETALGEGFEFVAMARALLREPDLVNKLADSRSTAGLCVHCNKCLPTIYSGTHCVLVPDTTEAR